MRDTIKTIKLAIEGEEYNFLKTAPDLGKNICLIKPGGSYAYGTNIFGSDIDVRGVCLNRTQDILGLKTGFEQYEDKVTDTVIYTVFKIVTKLIDCNPNTIEILSDDDDALFVDEIGQLLIDNASIFLSKRAFYSFGGYAKDQLNRLENALANRADTSEERQRHILNSIETKLGAFNLRNEGQMVIETLRDSNDELTFNLHGRGLRTNTITGILNEMSSIIAKYNNIGKRNKKKTIEGLSKHAMHLIRLYYMCIDILKYHRINTYREKEIGTLMEIRNSNIQDSTGAIRKDFLRLKDSLEQDMRRAFEATTLPDSPDMGLVNGLLGNINILTLKKRGIVR